LAGNDRILGRTGSRTGQAVATEHALVLGDHAGNWRRIDWAAIASAAWSPSDQSLTLRLWPTGDPEPEQIRLAGEERFAVIVRERVEYQRLLSVPVELATGILARVVALRDGDAVRWRVVVDRPLDSPALQDACTRAMAEIRSIAGL
jgi:hypothetical protein